VTASDTVQEALDRLLEPLDASTVRPDITQQDLSAPNLGAPTRVDLGALYLRLRRSRRLPYKVPRLLAGWTVLVVGICALVWLTFSIVGLR
jgi:hypothetical protein